MRSCQGGWFLNDKGDVLIPLRKSEAVDPDDEEKTLTVDEIPAMELTYVKKTE